MNSFCRVNITNRCVEELASFRTPVSDGLYSALIVGVTLISFYDNLEHS